MNCERVQRLLSMERDGRSTGREEAAVTAHLRDCPACLQFQRALDGFGGKVRQAGEWQPAARRDIRSRALDQWSSERLARAPWSWSMVAFPARARLASGALVAVVIVGLVWWLQVRQNGSPQSQIVKRNGLPHQAAPDAPGQKREGLGAEKALTPPPAPRVPGSPNPGRGGTKNGAPSLFPSPDPGRKAGDEGSVARPGTGHGSPQRPTGPQVSPDRAEPTQPAPSVPTPAPVPDTEFLDGRDPSLLTKWGPMDEEEQKRLQAILKQLPPPADDFVRIPFPRIAASGSGKTAIAAAAREYGLQAKVVDTRLFRQVTLQMKGASLADFCAQMQEQTGVTIRASRGVMDEKVTIFVKEQRARDVMRAVARLFGYFWLRSGSQDDYRYELDQDLKSRLVEEEIRNRDANAALLALDAEMEKYRPYLHLSLEELEKLRDSAVEKARDHYRRTGKQHEEHLRLFNMTIRGGWGAIQLYLRLSPADRAALAAGQELVFRPDAPDPDRRFPADVKRQILRSWGGNPDSEHHVSKIPGAHANQVRLRLDRSELGQLSLDVRMTARYPHRSDGSFMEIYNEELVTSRNPEVTKLANAKANAGLQNQSPFDQIVSVRPEPSCQTVRKMLAGQIKRLPYGLGSRSIGDLQAPHVFSADVWEAIHRETGLPIVADYYTRMHRLDQVTVKGKSLFEALCNASNAMGVKWTKEGGFILGRSASYYWDKLKEIPSRLLQRWIASRDANGGLPLADLLEMATLSDQQLDSVIVSEAITHCLGLRDCGHLRWPGIRRRARYFATLTPEQQRRAFTPEGVPFKELTPAQQQDAMQLQYAALADMERQNGSVNPIDPEWWGHAEISAEYVPAGWYAFSSRGFPPPVNMGQAVGRTAEEALAAARRLWPKAPAERVQQEQDGRFSAGVRFSFHN